MKLEIRLVTGTLDGKQYCWSVIEQDGQVLKEAGGYRSRRMAKRDLIEFLERHLSDK